MEDISDKPDKPSTELQTKLVSSKLRVYFEKKLPVHFSVIGSKSFKNGYIKEFDEEGGFFILDEFRDGEELFMFTEVFQDSVAIFKKPRDKEGSEGGDANGYL